MKTIKFWFTNTLKMKIQNIKLNKNIPTNL